ncbi:hypothetical protein B0T17DRAFT_546302 [Bombardia bombarda]|uniref:Glutathione S-transferase n=1 Tax=Bombardia bombarda TaxID=252184 RepID=A0AA39WBE9_9PEZI|nr:hypothetical protein B0T17DRAFT_546302 [Bombardia bombarda]
MATPTPAKKQQQDAKITLYWLDKSRAQRIVWLLEELHADYDVEVFYRTKDFLAPPELEKVHPLGKSPLVSITPNASAGDASSPRPTKVLAESGFITEYLCEHFGDGTNLVPERWPGGVKGGVCTETEGWMRYQHLLHYAEGSLMPPLLLSVIMFLMKGPKIPFFVRPITSMVANNIFSMVIFPSLVKHLDFLEDLLKTAPNGGGYLCGNHLTAVDILLSFPLLSIRERLGNLEIGGAKRPGKVLDNYPVLWAYVARLEEVDGYKRASAKIEEFEGKGKKQG